MNLSVELSRRFSSPVISNQRFTAGSGFLSTERMSKRFYYFPLLKLQNLYCILRLSVLFDLEPCQASTVGTQNILVSYKLPLLDV